MRFSQADSTSSHAGTPWCSQPEKISGITQKMGLRQLKQRFYQFSPNFLAFFMVFQSLSEWLQHASF